MQYVHTCAVTGKWQTQWLTVSRADDPVGSMTTLLEADTSLTMNTSAGSGFELGRILMLIVPVLRVEQGEKQMRVALAGD